MVSLFVPKEVLSAVALLLTFIAFYPYIRAIQRGQTRPHVFSWIIWGAGTVIVSIAQLMDGAGVGAWPIFISGLITIGVAMLALQKSADTRFLKTDWAFLTLALSAIPLWLLTKEALAAVAILTLVDLLGFGPSVRKAYDFPNEENATFFTLGALRNAIVVLALENHSWTTVLFPAAVGLACLVFVLMILVRRRALGRIRARSISS